MKNKIAILVIITLFLVVIGIVLFANFNQSNQTIPQPNDSSNRHKLETYCNIDMDCACGMHKETGEAFTGNKEYVDSTLQNPDQCTGWGGVFKLKCVKNECKWVKSTSTGNTSENKNQELISIAEKFAKNEGINLNEYKEPEIKYDDQKKQWQFYYEVKPPMYLGGCFQIFIDENTRDTRILYCE